MSRVRAFLPAAGGLLALCVGCVPQPQPSLLTATGKPEVTVAGATAGAVESHLVDVMVADGYRVASVTPTMAVFEKDAGLLASVLLGSRYDAIPKIRITCTLLELNGAVRVLADGAYITNPGSAFERRTDANSSKDMQQLQGVLESVRARFAADESASGGANAVATTAPASQPVLAPAVSTQPGASTVTTSQLAAATNPTAPTAAVRAEAPRPAPAPAPQPDALMAAAPSAAATEHAASVGTGSGGGGSNHGDVVAVRLHVSTPGFVVGDAPAAVSRYPVLVVGPAHDSTIVRTDEAGLATVALRPGHYRVAPYKSAAGPGGPYVWDLAFDVAAGMPTVELNADNARPRKR